MPRRERCPRCGSTNVTGRGFDLPGGDEAQERSCHACGHMEDRLRSQGGVSWYGDVADAPHRMHAAEGIEAKLLAEIRAAPDDDAPRSIYADWLIERGDPLGTFIALQLARARRRDAMVSDEEQQLLDAGWSSWIGERSARFEHDDVAFERGFWSMARAKDRVQVEQVLPGAPIAELRLAFEASHAPPSIAGLASLERLGVRCHPDFVDNWIERAHDSQRIVELAITSSLTPREVREAIRRARATRLARLVVELTKLVLLVGRDADGSFLVRSIRLEEPVVHDAKRWVNDLGDLVDPAVKLTADSIDPRWAELADRLGLPLVRSTRRCTAAPRR